MRRAVVAPVGVVSLVGVVALALALVACAPAPGRTGDVREVRVAAAADLTGTLEDVVALLAETHPDVAVAITYGSSGVFVQQISNGAPFDLYLSADADHPERLVRDGLADPDELFLYAVGRLALWVPSASPLDPAAGLALLADDTVSRVAIANPVHAPYGRAAQAAFEAAGVADDVAGKLVLGENVAQAADFVRSGNAQVGVIALPLVLSGPLADEGRWVEVPRELHPPIVQGGVVLPGAQDVAAARAVRDALLGPDGRAALSRSGFLPVEG